ncbi:MAG TPA: hypothetical protein VNF72_19225 [Myxococcota bacterium]|jgi:hypothetical protein|nr:hypothetical protein [Myxococcota bacterium]
MRVALALSSLALVGLLSAAGHARAEEKPCRQQLDELCPKTEPNTPERRACVQENVEKLTESCQTMIGHVKDAKPGAPPTPAPGGGLQGLVQACAKDHPRMVELCQKDKPPAENPMPCLVKHADQFSEPCRNWILDAEKAQAQKAPVAGKPPAAAKSPAPAN